MSNQPTNYSTDSEETLVENNLKLVHHYANKYLNTGYTHEELYAEGLMGLLKAARTWNASKSKFVTYASTCINNEILMLLRKSRRHPIINSLDEAIPTAKVDRAEANMYDFIPHGNSTDGDVIFQQYLAQVKEYIEALPERDRRILVATYGLGGVEPVKQYDLASELQLSQSYVSRVLKNITAKLYAYIAHITDEEAV